MKLLGGAALVALTGLLVQAPEQIEAGRKVYESEKCGTCHQVAGRGNRMFPLDGVGDRLSADEIRRWFTHTEAMENALPRRPAIRMSSRKYNFSDADLDALVAYLQSLKTSR
jgi:cytochrome c2